jgi:hypothetical protein
MLPDIKLHVEKHGKIQVTMYLYFKVISEGQHKHIYIQVFYCKKSMVMYF